MQSDIVEAKVQEDPGKTLEADRSEVSECAGQRERLEIGGASRAVVHQVKEEWRIDGTSAFLCSCHHNLQCREIVVERITPFGSLKTEQIEWLPVEGGEHDRIVPDIANHLDRLAAAVGTSA